MNSRIGCSLLFLMVYALLPATVVPAAGEKAAAPSGCVALVNGVAITAADVEQKMAEIREQYARQGQPVDEQKLEDLRPKVVDNLIEEELLFQESRRQKINVAPAAMDAALADIRKGFEDEEKFDAALQAMHLTRETFTRKLERLLAIRELIQSQVDAQIEVPEEEIRTFYSENPQHFETSEKIRARHILIQLKPDADEAARKMAMKKIGEVKKKLAQGADFAELAKQYSEGPSKTRGGDLGFFGRGRMVKPFEDAAFALEAGGTSDMVETQFGLHLIRVEEKQPGGTVPYEKAHDSILAHLKKQKRGRAIMTYLQNLKNDAAIEKFPSAGNPPQPSAPPS
jgi:peptidyl-prolyl cis-trans isomerase C